MKLKHILLAGLLAVAWIIAPHAQTYNVTTLAGGLEKGSADGVGTTSRFYTPVGVAVDDQGNVYAADTFNNTIRRITADGVVITVAGRAGSPGSADGVGSEARFYHPNGLVLDQQGSVYITDTANRTIRKIDRDGLVTTLAGKVGDTASVDGTGSEARFGGPVGITLDNSGNLIVADTWGPTIRKVTTNGVVTTLRDSTGSIILFQDPRGVAVDPEGNIFVADGVGHRIQKVTPQGNVVTFAGATPYYGFKDGVGTAARFGGPAALAMDTAGNLFVADDPNNTLRKITPEAVVTTIAGTAAEMNGYVDGIGSVARFTGPIGIAVDKWGNLYIGDEGNNMIRKATPILPLQIKTAGTQLSVSWPTWAVKYVLESAPILGDTNAWSLVTDTTNISTNLDGSSFVYKFNPEGSGRHFRVRSQ